MLYPALNSQVSNSQASIVGQDYHSFDPIFVNSFPSSVQQYTTSDNYFTCSSLAPNSTIAAYSAVENTSVINDRNLKQRPKSWQESLREIDLNFSDSDNDTNEAGPIRKNLSKKVIKNIMKEFN